MFLEMLEKKEIISICALINSMALADGNIDENEKKYIQKYEYQYGINFQKLNKVDIDEACSGILSNRAKVIALQEIVKIAICDDYYDESEKNKAIEISKKIGISNDEFSKIESWVIEGHQWVKRGYEMAFSE